MTKYLITYECAHWCGGESQVVVNAESELEAEDKAAEHMDSEMYELFSNEYGDESDLQNEQAYSVISVEEFDSTHEYWKFYKDPSQSQFFPEIF